jgi:Transposase DDE domain
LKITQIRQAIERVLDEDVNDLAREMKVVVRQSKITGQSLAQGLVFAFLANPQAREIEVAQGVACAGEAVTAQAVNAKLTENTARFLLKLLERTARQVMPNSATTQTLLSRFSAVNVNDSTTITLPNELSHIWAGCGNRTAHGKAAAKLQVQWDLKNGTLQMLTVHDGREQDRSAPVQKSDVQPGSLRLADLGYFDVSYFHRIGAAKAYWLSRYLSGVLIFDESGAAVDLWRWLSGHCNGETQVDMPVLVSAKHLLPARMVAVRVTQEVADGRRRRLHDAARGKAQAASPQSLALADWSIFLTNVPVEMLSVPEVLVIAHARWQVELLFKLWKSSGRIDESRSKRPYRILCEFYAKVIGQIIQHWLIVHLSWHIPDRSMTKVAAAVQSCARSLQIALQQPTDTLFVSIVTHLSHLIAASCHIDKRNARPALFQLLALNVP